MTPLDALIVGAGPAGLSAGLMLGRCRRTVLICDEGKPRNAVSHGLHGFLSRDGLDPEVLRRIGREQLARYDTVGFREDRVESGRRTGDGFAATLSDGTAIEARKLLLAGGRRDHLPPIEGLQELWGTSVFPCRYCDGWELRGQPLAVLTGENANWDGDAELAVQLTQLSDDVVLCTNGPFELQAAKRQRLASYGVQVRTEKIVSLQAQDGLLSRVVFAEGEALVRQAAFLDTAKSRHDELADGLGCAILTDGCVEVDDRQQTSQPGVYAAGDISRRPGRPVTNSQIVIAAAEGATAAIAIDLELFS